MSAQVPLVAVITRTKDRPLLLERAIKSVMHQTMTDFVMVIINDGGDKKTLEELVAKHKTLIDGRVKVIHNATSIGMQPASNKAIKSVDSTYVVVHDDDDSWHEDFLKKTTEHMAVTGAKGVIAITDIVIEEVSDTSIKTIETKRFYPGLRFISLYKMCLENYAAPISFIYRREVFAKIGYYDETLGGVGDWDFGLRFLVEYDIDLLTTEQALAYYHHRPNATGINANSVYTNTHKNAQDYLLNRYLRADIASGKLGLGYIMNSVSHSHDLVHAVRQEVQVQERALEARVDASSRDLFMASQVTLDQLARLEKLNVFSLSKRAAKNIKHRVSR